MKRREFIALLAGPQTRWWAALSSFHQGLKEAGYVEGVDHIVLGQEALDRISEVVLPGSSLIISDEDASVETGKDTDFVVILSGEPQGGLKMHQRQRPSYRDDFFGGGGGSFFPFV